MTPTENEPPNQSHAELENDLAQFDELLLSRSLPTAADQPNLSADHTISPEADSTLIKMRRTIELFRMMASSMNASNMGTDRDASTVVDTPIIGQSTELTLEDGLMHYLPERYEIARRLGEGGFGIVLLARDLHLNRLVALKLPKPEVTIIRGLTQRFMREAQNVAQLDHPNIVPVLGTDESSSMPLIVYHYCEGPTLARWLQDRQTPVDSFTAVHIALLLTDAIHHAHQRGILHRDLKLTNILLEESQDAHAKHGFKDGEKYWSPRVTDFGISKAFDSNDDSCTVTGLLLGTLHYMAPEQLAANQKEIGWHSDVYSLGVILFELLTRRRPYEAENAVDLLVQMRSREPNLRRLRPDISRDLEAVVNKAIHVDIRGRYPTVFEFHCDLDNIIQRKPVAARPVSTRLRLQRWVQRQPVVASLSLVSVLLLLVACALAGFYVRDMQESLTSLQAKNVELAKSRDLVTDLAIELNNKLYVSDMREAWEALTRHDLVQYERIMQRYADEKVAAKIQSSSLASTDPNHLRLDVRDLAHTFLHQYVRRKGIIVAALKTAIHTIDISPNGLLVAAGGKDGQLRLYDLQSDELQTEFPADQGELNCVEFSDDGSKLATLGEHSSVCIWDVASKTLLSRFQSTANTSYDLVWINAQTVAVSGSDPPIRLWNWRDGSDAGQLLAHTRGVEALEVSTDRTTLFSGGDDWFIYSWSLKDLKSQAQRKVDGRVLDLAISDDSTKLLFGDVSGKSATLLATNIEEMSASEFHARDRVRAVALSTDGRLGAVGSDDGVVHVNHLDIRNPFSPREDPFPQIWQAHADRVNDIALSEDKQWIYTAGKDGLLKKWSALPQHHVCIPAAVARGIQEFDKESCLFNIDEDVYRWFPASNQLRFLGAAPISFNNMKFDVSTNVLFTKRSDGTHIDAWHLDFDKSHNTFKPLWSSAIPHEKAVPAYAPTHKLIACACDSPSPKVVLLDATKGHQIRELKLDERRLGYLDGGLVFSPSGDLLAVAFGKYVYLFDVGTGESRVLEGHDATICALNFDSSGRYLASGDETRQIRLWEFEDPPPGSQHVPELRKTMELSGHLAEIKSILFSPDQKSLVSIDVLGHTIFWKLSTGELSLEIVGNGQIDVSLEWNGPWLYRARTGNEIYADRLVP